MKKNWKKISLICVLVVLVVVIYYCFFLGPSLKFKAQEDQLLEAGKLYFERNSYLISNNKTVREISLSKLYDQKYLDTLYIPNSKKLCDAKESFVKVKNENGKLEYLAYLECGKYHSTVDHEGPEILLNGDSTVTVARGKDYKEEGIKQVKDNYDGTMKTSDVDIDSSKIKTDEAGTYKVTYTAYDSWRNKTVVTRKVKVVQKLLDTIQEDTDGRGYYQGDADNYLMMNAMLWRVVGLSDDGNITIVMDEPVANVDYSLAKGNQVKGSSIDKWLNDYFYEKLSSKTKKLLVKNSSWCTDKISQDNLNTTECKSTTKMNVGLISIQDYNKSLQGETSYLDNYSIVSWMMNPNTVDDSAWAQRDNFIYEENAFFKSYEDELLYGVRPAVRLQKDVEITGGTGTVENPYLVGDMTTASRNDLLNTRTTGEFVTYSGYLFRIVETLKDGTTHVIQDGVLTNDGEVVTIDYDDTITSKIYNPNQKGNIGYTITNRMTGYIQTSYFVKKKVTVPIYKERAIYQKETDTKSYSVKVAAPNTFDLFSAKRGGSSTGGFWYINSSKDEYEYLTGSLGTLYNSPNPSAVNTGVKISAYFSKDIKIRDGEGTVSDPYRLTK